ncbi:MAG: chromosome segregation protein SMC [Phycisphaerae bacterium]
MKRITLNGFKSFADRTTFEFGPGITSIVGPNGCGKSNVLDALRWVLGEQSARSLRGTRMADVIFSGSRSRRPAVCAEVELTFDNRSHFLSSDQDEVAVTRMLFASGDSEYRINGNSCRLKDIRDLFLDTGVGVDAYSVIEQGRVDVLLQASPVERREIFEEAAGISRYKVRRTEAQRKLERTQNNLLRLNDLVDELEKRLRSVKLAAGKARNYQQLDGRLRELRSAFALAEYHQFEQSRHGHESAAELLSERAHAKRVALAACDARSSELQHEQQGVDELLRIVESELLALQSEASALAERLAQNERRITDLLALRERRAAHAQELAARAADVEQRVGAEHDGLRDLLAEIETHERRLEELRVARSGTERRAESVRRTLEAERAAALDAVRRCSHIHNELFHAAEAQRRARQQFERIELRSGQIAENRADVLRRRAAAEDRRAAIGVQRRECDDELARLDAETESRAAEAATRRQHITRQREERSAVLSRLELLSDMDRRLEGVDQAARAVLAWRATPQSDGSVVGLVADCVRIDNPRVQLLDPLLATFENHIVVRDTHVFLAELRRRGDLPGPVAVLALDRLSTAHAWVRHHDAPGFVAHARDWVSCAPEFAPLADHLLGGVVIVDAVERALALGSHAPDSAVFVTLDGAAVGGDGRLRFGGGRATQGLISRKAEIRTLEAELEALDARLHETLGALDQLEQTTDALRVRRNELLATLGALQRQDAECAAEVARLDDEADRLARERDVLAADALAAQRAMDELGARAEQLQAERAAADAEQQAREDAIRVQVEELAEIDATVSHLAQELTEARVAVGRAGERRSAAEQALAELRAQAEELLRNKLQAEREAADALVQLESTQTESASARARQIDVAAECDARQTAASAHREQRQALRGALEAVGVQSRELQADVEELDERLHEHRAELREIAVRTETLATRTREDLGLDLVELYAAYEHADQDWDAIRAEIDDLRGRIARLGHVNLDAIAELEELAPRYEHMVAQRADLQSSIERLEALIGELDQESQTRFQAAFVAIREYFQELYRKLFGGGKADIILEDPTKPLECGIEIIARPPGKEPQSISLLSGGEKTLTAVALLLAVFRSRPSPFAILDEVDAALDESNIERFNSVVEEFLDQSQFIVITHSKRTMQHADVIYGITMEEPGVSKRVSVRMDQRVKAPVLA